MKQILALALLATVALAGCGKSAEQTKVEEALNAEVTKLHDNVMASLKGVDGTVAEIDQAVTKHNDLAAKFAKQAAGHSADDLTAAKDQLLAVKTRMNDWMKGYKPYDPSKKHEEVLAGLTKAKEDLAKMNTDLGTAMAAATNAVSAHKAFADNLMAKAGKGKK